MGSLYSDFRIIFDNRDSQIPAFLVFGFSMKTFCFLVLFVCRGICPKFVEILKAYFFKFFQIDIRARNHLTKQTQPPYMTPILHYLQKFQAKWTRLILTLKRVRTTQKPSERTHHTSSIVFFLPILLDRCQLRPCASICL